jgi:hypothetical protein
VCGKYHWDYDDGMEGAASLIAVCDDPDSNFSVVVEQDSKVAYAYLRRGEEIVGDVWLYNRGPAPARSEWDDPARTPFANVAGYVRDEPPPTGVREDDVSCRWRRGSEGLEAVDVLIRGTVYGRLAPGTKPGWARLASRDGPCAKVLRDDNRVKHLGASPN